MAEEKKTTKAEREKTTEKTGKTVLPWITVSQACNPNVANINAIDAIPVRRSKVA